MTTKVPKKEISEAEKLHAVHALGMLQKVNFITDEMRRKSGGMMFAGKMTEKEKRQEKREKLIIAKVDLPHAGGVHSFYMTESGKLLRYPQKGFAVKETVYILNFIKKFFIAFLKSFKFNIFILFSVNSVIKNVVKSYSNYMTDLHDLKDNRWCDCVREFRRAFDTLPIKDTQFKIALKFVLSLLLEFDDAYRYRFQWAMGKFLQKKIMKGAVMNVKEIRRLLKLVSEHENDRRLPGQWLMMRKAALGLYLFPSFRKMIKQLFETADINALSLSLEDKYHCTLKNAYRLTFRWDFPEYEEFHDDLKKILGV